MNYLVWKSDLPRSTVAQYIREFRKLGILEDVGRRSDIDHHILKHSERDTSVVQVHLDKLPRKTPWRKSSKEASPATGLPGSGSQRGVVQLPEVGSPVAGIAIRKEPSFEPSLEPSENHHACGALNDWLQIKSKLEKQLPEEQFKLWLRPMYLLKVMSGRVLLLALPPNGRIVEAARFHQEELLKLVREAGYSSFCLRRYPDNYERERLRKEHPDFYAQMYGQKVKQLAGFPDAIPPAETNNRLAQKQAAMEVA